MLNRLLVDHFENSPKQVFSATLLAKTRNYLDTKQLVTGQTLAKHWPNTGQTLAKHWPKLANRWPRLAGRLPILAHIGRSRPTGELVLSFANRPGSPMLFATCFLTALRW
jgi:hypothetical protein